MRFLQFIIFLFFFSSCVLLKGPAAKVLSMNLPEAAAEQKKDTTDLSRANYNLNIITLQGDTMSLEQSKGKVIFLNFWATWCAPCVAELPSIERLAEQFKDNENVLFVLASNEPLEKVTRFVTKKKYKAGYYITPPNQIIPQEYMTQYIPATYVLSKDGWIQFQKMGAEKYDSDEFVTFLKMLANE